MILIFTTFGKKPEAIKIGKLLLKQRLIACYNLFPIESAYWWKSKLVDDKEFLMILKTKEANFKKIESFIKNHHTYEVPEIVAVKTSSVSKSYMDWLHEELSSIH